MARSKSLRVLLAGTHAALERSLSNAGHDVDVGADSLSALSVAEAYSLDVVIIDREAFQGEPFALARAIRVASFGYKPLFVLLARGHDHRLEEQCRDAGIDLLLFEPVTPALLTGFLDRLRAVVAEYEEFDPAI